MAESSPPGGTQHLRCLHAGTATPRRGPGQGSGDDPLGSLCCQGHTQGPSILLLVCLWELRELGDGNTSDKWARGGHSYAQAPSDAAARVRHLHAPLPLRCLLHFSWAAKLAGRCAQNFPAAFPSQGCSDELRRKGCALLRAHRDPSVPQDIPQCALWCLQLCFPFPLLSPQCLQLCFPAPLGQEGRDEAAQPWGWDRSCLSVRTDLLTSKTWPNTNAEGRQGDGRTLPQLVNEC